MQVGDIAPSGDCGTATPPGPAPAPDRRAALAAQALRERGHGARLLHELTIARGDGRYPKLLASFAKTDLLVLDDFGLAKLNSDNRRDLLELLEDRYASRSTLVISQLPLAQWHELLGDPTLADAILDRLVHNAYTRIIHTLHGAQGDNVTTD